MNNSFKQIIQEICNEENIKFKFLSKDWVIMLEKNGNTKFISGHKFDLNEQGIGLVADDKFALYEVFKAKNLPIIEHNIVYNKTNKNDYAIGCNTYEYVKDYFIKNNNSIVVKPNDGTCGKNVYHITDINEIDTILDKVFASYYSISICPFYDIKHEYRVIMLDKDPQLLYAKYLPIVKGDGIKSIRELLIEFNHDFFIDRLDDSKYDQILEKNKEFQYNWKFNLSQGSIAKKVNDKNLADKILNLAAMVCDNINLRFGSIDIIQTTDNNLYVLEVNSGVMMDNFIRLMPEGYITAKKVYKKAIKELFMK